jgi:hypothetical protein
MVVLKAQDRYDHQPLFNLSGIPKRNLKIYPRNGSRKLFLSQTAKRESKRIQECLPPERVCLTGVSQKCFYPSQAKGFLFSFPNLNIYLGFSEPSRAVKCTND